VIFYGAPYIYYKGEIVMSRFNEDGFIEKFKAINGDKYEYLGYEKGLVKFLCKKHNEINYDTPSHLLSGRGCKVCGKEKRGQYNALMNELARKTFIEKAKKIHGDKYDYSKVNYIKNDIKVTIGCHIHGDFEITPNAHLNGQGCKKCGIERVHNAQRKSKEEFVEEAKKIHGDKYDYSKVEYKNTNDKVCIICPKHGEFWQSPLKHLYGRGCRKCGREFAAQLQSLTTETFIEKAKKIHGNKYDYSKVEYNGYEKKVKIICPIHGEFEQTPDSHLQGSGCRQCSSRLSKNEDEIYNFIGDLIGKENVLKSVRDILRNHSEIDIFIPSKNIGIEYNGCRWHSEQFGKGKYYHLNKTEECFKKGIRLIQIFEDEYIDKKELILDKIKHIIKCDNLQKIGARKCTVSEISYSEAKTFLNENHIQGQSKATVYVGAKYDDKLIGVMTFVKYKDNKWELNRFATDKNYICQGIGGKLFSYFTKKYNPVEIKSFADRRWTTQEENLYLKLGFELKNILEPDYRYVIDGSYKRIHKFNFRKNVLHKKYGFPLSMTETQMAEKLNAYKIWDCGLLKYVWKKTES
jgi:hypothetical protein